MALTLLLFDVDGVLIRAHGYKEALRATLDVIAGQMGQPPVNLTADEIAVFESSGLTSEWDSGALAAAILLSDILNVRPDLRRETLDDTLAALRAAGVVVPRPDFAGRARALMAAHPPGATHPSLTALAALKETSDSALHPLLEALLANVYVLQAPFTYIFQHYTLGSDRFAHFYDEIPRYQTGSLLLAHDEPLITPETTARLLELTARLGWRMAIFTARPSLPPADLPAPDGSLPRHYFPPEGDLALELLGLSPHHCPLIAGGRLTWLAARRGRGSADYVKPSPVHALAAIAAAASGSEAAALESAADLAESGRLTGPLAGLAGTPARVVVFEDSAGGILAARRAAGMLQAAGAPVTVEAVGISTHAAKHGPLAEVSDRIAGDINAALEPYFNERRRN